MKIEKVNWLGREARFVLFKWPQKTFCIKLDDKTTAKEVTDELKVKADVITTRENTDQELQDKYNSFNLKALEGTDL